MSDLIDRQAAIDAFEALDWYHQNISKDMVLGANSAEHQAWYKADDVYKTIEDLPSAQPERKTGKWFWTDGMYACDQCHAVLDDMSPFCPMCGADMREERKGNL